MIKPRSVSSFIRAILSADKGASVNVRPGGRLEVWFRSALGKDEIVSEYDVPVVDSSFSTGRNGWPVFRVKFDVSAIGKKERPKKGTGFTFDKINQSQRLRDSVREQEDDGAELIGGQRHVGSGAIADLKSDASSERWQQEAKQTRAASISLTVAWLDKITREARVNDKRPMMHLRFTNLPDDVVAGADWVVIPADVFYEMRRIEEEVDG